jgi:uncharacterized protein
MFKEKRDKLNFQWSNLGDINEGRPNLGDRTAVSVYRLMQFTLRDVLIKRYTPEAAAEIYFEAGHTAGVQFCRNLLNSDLKLNEFIAQMQETLKDLGVGILRVEKLDQEKMKMVITMEEDLDCSGLPMMSETVCDYDEGFLAGVMEEYTGKAFSCREIDCWATGARICRFNVDMI